MHSSLKIAVLEDNDELRELMIDLLQKNGYQAMGAFDAEGLDSLIMQHQFDLLLLDLNLPGEHGLSVAKRLKSALPSLYIIMTTALSGTNERVIGYQQGADLYLPKPVSEQELLAAISSVARRINQIRNRLTTNELTLDLKRRQLIGTHTVDLSPTETILLKQLILSTHKKVDYFKLLETTKREVDAKSKASLEVQIVNLRKKIAAAGYSKPSVRSVRNEGYELLCPIALTTNNL
ncbi:response regulator transcription factor [Rhizobiales bacterium TNE-4]|nr:response regulator transcription factor [Rhizobiales bacterium TNE-4]MBV1828050.1 response regulator transcription factor [Rhizobiales bacterium TNE-4]